MRFKPLPSQSLLREMFLYDADAGLLIERSSGKEAGFITEQGYRRVNIASELFLVHRVIWKIVTGSDPKQMDHRNGQRADNRLANLREATHSENCLNRSFEVGQTGRRGVVNKRGKFQVRVYHDGCRINVGTYPTIEEASAAYERVAGGLSGTFRKPRAALSEAQP